MELLKLNSSLEVNIINLESQAILKGIKNEFVNAKLNEKLIQ